MPMDDPFTIALGVGSAALGAAQASQQRSAIKRSASSAYRAADAQNTQDAAAARLEQAKRLREAQIARGRLYALAAERGVGDAGSVAALDRQISLDNSLNQQIIATNQYNQSLRVRSQYEATTAELSARAPSLFLSAFNSGLQGFQTGLQITSGLESLDETQRRRDIFAQYNPELV